MPLVETDTLKLVERLSGWKGRYLHTPNLTIALYQFARGAEIHEHSHASEEIYLVQSGEIEIVIDGNVHTARPGSIAVVPSGSLHRVRARTDGELLIVAHPARPKFG